MADALLDKRKGEAEEEIDRAVAWHCLDTRTTKVKLRRHFKQGEFGLSEFKR